MTVLDGLGEFATAIPYGLGFGLGLLGIRVLAMVIAQWNIKEDRIDKGTKTIIEQLTSEVQRLSARLEIVERDLEECKKHRDELETERARWRGYSQGRGDGMQKAALIVAEERRKDREA